MDINYVTLCQIDELMCLRVDHPQAKALIALQGAQLLEYTPTGEQPVIWLSELAEFKKGKSIRGGIPICWPWFGDARKNPESVQKHLPKGALPAHGWVRDKPWLLEWAASDEESAHLRFRFPTNIWPAPFPNGVELSMEMRIGTTLQMCLTTNNQSDQTVNFSQALHSYFAISDVDSVQIGNLEGVTYIDTLVDWQENSSDTPLAIGEEVDRIYVDTPKVITIADSRWQRTIQLTSPDAKSAVVWNPWIEKSKRLGQFADDAYERMVCVESGNTANKSLLLREQAAGHLRINVGLRCPD